MKNAVKLCLLSLATMAMISGCGKQGAGSEKINLTYSIFFPPTHVQCKLADEWAAEVANRTGDRVKVTVYPGALSPDRGH